MTSPEVEQVGASRAWTAFLVVIAVGHHLGTLSAPLGDVGVIQWTDLADLLLPYAVVATARVALVSVGLLSLAVAGALAVL